MNTQERLCLFSYILTTAAYLGAAISGLLAMGYSSPEWVFWSLLSLVVATGTHLALQFRNH